MAFQSATGHILTYFIPDSMELHSLHQLLSACQYVAWGSQKQTSCTAVKPSPNPSNEWQH